jgi:hypothetical protein
MDTLIDQIRADLARKDACPLHQFSGDDALTLGATYPCKSCGGKFRLSEIGLYLRGYAAAGGDVNVIWPGWNGRRKTL